MEKLNTYSLSGTKTSINLPKSFQEKVNLDLLAQAVRIYQDRSHPGNSKVQTRGDMHLTTAKTWRQKGTGRARHGARSAPIFVGGGVAHGPKGFKRTLKIPEKMARKSLLVALSFKANKGDVVAVSNLVKINKTKVAQKLVDTIIAKENLKKGARVSLIIKSENSQVKLAFRNIKNVQVLSFEYLNTLDVYQGGLLIFENEILDSLNKTKVVLKDKVEKKVVVKKTKAANKVQKKAPVKEKSKKGTK